MAVIKFGEALSVNETRYEECDSEQIGRGEEVVEGQKLGSIRCGKTDGQEAFKVIVRGLNESGAGREMVIVAGWIVKRYDSRKRS